MTQDSGLNSDMPISDVLDSSLSDISLFDKPKKYLIFKAKSQGRIVVLKTVNRNHEYAADLKKNLAREYDLLQQLDNPYIVRAWQMKDVPKVGRCIIMEYVDGVSLTDFLTPRPSSKQRYQVLCELIEALSYLHSKQIVHGDIKPQNILITRNGNHVKLIDFGFASKDDSIAKNVGYTATYAAPEQCGKITAPLSERTDIYALGQIIKLLYPYKYLFVQHKCLRTQPTQRYANVHYVKRALGRYPWYRFALLCVCILFFAVIAFGLKPTISPVEPFAPKVEDTMPIVLPKQDTLFELDSPLHQQAEQAAPTQTPRQQLNQAVSTQTPTQSAVWITEQGKVLTSGQDEIWTSGAGAHDIRQEVHAAYRRLYEACLDSLASMPYQYQDFGSYYLSYMAKRMYAMHLELKAQYAGMEDQIESDYMVQYGVYYPLLATRINALPNLWVCHEKGELTREEYDSLHSLIRFYR